MNNSEIMICVSGNWKSRTEVVTSIATMSDGYLFAGLVLMDTQTNEGFKAKVDENEDNSYIFCIIGDGSTNVSARKLMKATLGILKAGGISVKDVTTGRFYTKEEWASLAVNDDNIWH